MGREEIGIGWGGLVRKRGPKGWAALQGGARRPPRKASATNAKEPRGHRQECLCHMLDAGAGGVGPCELDGERAELLGFPGADVADFAVVVVVPALAGGGGSDGFAEVVRAGGRQRGQGGESPGAAG